jgi:RNA polymerase sigma-70 factor (ECF subfamily)
MCVEGALDSADEDIARRIRGGDPRAFDAFFSRYGGPLLGYLTGMLGERSLAEDLVQETVLRVYRGIGRYQEQGAFRSWVFRIATNVAYTELRRRRLATEPLDARILELPDPVPADPLARLEAEQREDLIRAGLGTLPDEQRATLLLRVRDGMPLREIAHALCIPEGTVKSRIHHAVRSLKEFVEGARARDRGAKP